MLLTRIQKTEVRGVLSLNAYPEKSAQMLQLGLVP